MTNKNEIEITGIRSASVSWEIYNKFMNEPSTKKRIEYALSIPTVKITLSEVTPIVLKNLTSILKDELAEESKKGRKAIRHLSVLMARSATRATPSRLAGKIGNCKTEQENEPHQIIFDDKITVACIRSTEFGEKKDETSNEWVRWNPSSFSFGGRMYITAPRKGSTKPYESVGRNKVIDQIALNSSKPIKRSKLISDLSKAYPEATGAVIKNAIQTLIDQEFLLEEADLGYYEQQRKASIREKKFSAEFELEEMQKFLETEETYDIESSRSAIISEDIVDFDVVKECFNYLTKNSLIESTDKGVSGHFAALLHEKYGYSRIRLSDLAHPSFGLSYKKIVADFQRNSSSKCAASMVALFSTAMMQADKWIDLNAASYRNAIQDSSTSDNDILKIDTSQLESYAVPMAPYAISNNVQESEKGIKQYGNIILFACDGTVALPGYAIHSRYHLSKLGELNHQHNPNSVQDVNIDWVSPDRATNAIRENDPIGGITINVNSFNVIGHEILPNEIYLWSDGEKVSLEKQNGEKIRVPPQSMISISLLPEWLTLIFLASTQNWPTMRWSWDSFENYSDFLPGVHYKNIVLQRPKFRYRGPGSFEKFNSWCNKKGISAAIRIGQMDRKVLLDRNSNSAKACLLHLLQSSDGWFEEANLEIEGPLSVDSTGRKIHSELVVQVNSEDFSKVRDLKVRPKFSDVNDNLYGQIIPSISSEVNLEIVPRQSSLSSMVGWLRTNIDIPFYFVRYRTSSGFPCLRFRAAREDIARSEVSDKIRKLVSDGWVAEISENQHRLEIERYGGLSSFDAFRRLFIMESRLIGDLINEVNFEEWSLQLKTSLVYNWVAMSPIQANILKADNIKTDISMRRFHFDKNSVDNIINENARVYYSVKKLKEAFIDVAKEATNLADSWAVAAHLFCNRLGITPEDEQRLWNTLRYIR